MFWPSGDGTRPRKPRAHHRSTNNRRARAAQTKASGVDKASLVQIATALVKFALVNSALVNSALVNSRPTPRPGPQARRGQGQCRGCHITPLPRDVTALPPIVAGRHSGGDHGHIRAHCVRRAGMGPRCGHQRVRQRHGVRQAGQIHRPIHRLGIQRRLIPAEMPLHRAGCRRCPPLVRPSTMSKRLLATDRGKIPNQRAQRRQLRPAPGQLFCLFPVMFAQTHQRHSPCLPFMPTQPFTLLGRQGARTRPARSLRQHLPRGARAHAHPHIDIARASQAVRPRRGSHRQRPALVRAIRPAKARPRPAANTGRQHRSHHQHYTLPRRSHAPSPLRGRIQIFRADLRGGKQSTRQVQRCAQPDEDSCPAPRPFALTPPLPRIGAPVDDTPRTFLSDASFWRFFLARPSGTQFACEYSPITKSVAATHATKAPTFSTFTDDQAPLQINPLISRTRMNSARDPQNPWRTTLRSVKKSL